MNGLKKYIKIMSVAFVLFTSSLFANDLDNGTIVYGNNGMKDLRENDVLTRSKPNSYLNDPEVIRLMNESYSKGFEDGAYESELVMKRKLDRMSKYMDSLFAFHKLYLEGKLEPPKIGVVVEPIQVTKDGKVMVIQQEHLEILEPAKFIDNTKTWRNFLIN